MSAPVNLSAIGCFFIPFFFSVGYYFPPKYSRGADVWDLEGPTRPRGDGAGESELGAGEEKRGERTRDKYFRRAEFYTSIMYGCACTRVCVYVSVYEGEKLHYTNRET